MTAETNDELRALVASSNSKQIAQVAENINAMAAREMGIAKGYAQLLQRSGPEWIKNATPGQLTAFTRVAAYLGLNPLMGEIYLMHSAVYVSQAGRLKLAQRTGEFDGISEPRMLTPEQRQVHGVRDGDVARIVEVWRKGMRLPAVGVGIIRKGELDEALSGPKGRDGLPFKPIGRNPEFMAAKRAQVAGLRVAFPDLDVAVVDLEERGVRGYVAHTIDGAFVDSFEADDTPTLAEERERVRLERGTMADISEAVDSEFVEDVTTPVTPYDVFLHAVVPVLYPQDVPDDAEDDANVALGGIPAWIEQYGTGTESVQSAIEIAAAVAAELAAGAPSLAMAASKVHRVRAEAGQPFNAETIDVADAPAPTETPAPARQARTRQAVQQPLT